MLTNLESSLEFQKIFTSLKSLTELKNKNFKIVPIFPKCIEIENYSHILKNVHKFVKYSCIKMYKILVCSLCFRKMFMKSRSYI